METKINTVAVIGAGVMGQGIVQVFATSGFKTILFDINSEILNNGMIAIHNSLETGVKKGKLSPEQKRQAENNIVLCESLARIKADLIIEAVLEKLDVKQSIFSALEKINSPTAILATNTSSLSVTEIAGVLTKADRFLGLHFFNPAHQMRLVEVIAGVSTNPELINEISGLLKKIGKIPVPVKDSPGFIVNRVARHYYVESLKVLEDKVSDVPGIDKLLKSAEFKMGPFELMDLIGVDTNYSVTDSLYKAFYPDPKFMPNPLQWQKIKDGHLGRKTGKGFYEYPKN